MPVLPVLVLVVGPSGVGKDTLIDAARRALTGDERFRFVRRAITRPAGAGGEDHEALTETEFAARRFAMQWRAHGWSYGIPEDIAHDLAQGRVVIANVSRTVIAEAAARFAVRVIEITAPPTLRAARLAGRGRESPDAIAARLDRGVALPPGVCAAQVANDASAETGAARFLAALREMCGQEPG